MWSEVFVPGSWGGDGFWTKRSELAFLLGLSGGEKEGHAAAEVGDASPAWHFYIYFVFGALELGFISRVGNLSKWEQ